MERHGRSPSESLAVVPVRPVPPLDSWPRKRPVDAIRDTIRAAQLVTDPRGFLKRELYAAAGPWQYVLRRGGRVVFVRHRTTDVGVLHEIFVRGAYRVPRDAMRSLQGLGRPIRAADLGSNVGLFGVYLLGLLPVSLITAFEPDEANGRVLVRCAAANGGTERWRIVEACAAASNGKVPFTAGRFTRSGIATDAQIATLVDAVDAFEYLRDADLVKMDIEGGEWPILADPRLSELAATAVVLEYHPDLCPYPDPRRAVVSLLERAGFTLGVPEERPDGVGIVWAWRTPERSLAPPGA